MSAKSTHIRPGTTTALTIACTAHSIASSRQLRTSASRAWPPMMSIDRSLGMTTVASQTAARSRSPASAWRMRPCPSNPNGFATIAIVSAPASRARCATNGAATTYVRPNRRSGERDRRRPAPARSRRGARPQPWCRSRVVRSRDRASGCVRSPVSCPPRQPPARACRHRWQCTRHREGAARVGARAATRRRCLCQRSPFWAGAIGGPTRSERELWIRRSPRGANR